MKFSTRHLINDICFLNIAYYLISFLNWISGHKENVYENLSYKKTPHCKSVGETNFRQILIRIFYWSAKNIWARLVALFDVSSTVYINKIKFDVAIVFVNLLRTTRRKESLSLMRFIFELITFLVFCSAIC